MVHACLQNDLGVPPIFFEGKDDYRRKYGMVLYLFALYLSIGGIIPLVREMFPSFQFLIRRCEMKKNSDTDQNRLIANCEEDFFEREHYKNKNSKIFLKD